MNIELSKYEINLILWFYNIWLENNHCDDQQEVRNCQNLIDKLYACLKENEK